MVLFHEDDIRIKEMERQQESKLRRRLRRVFRIFLVVAVLSGLGLLALNAVGGKGDALKQGAQDFLHQISGMEPSIDRFGGVTFFPSVSGDIGDIGFSSGGGTPLRIGHLEFSIGFWDVMFSTGRLRALEILDAWAAPGLYTRDAVSLDRIGIDPVENAPETAQLSARGKYGTDSFMVTLGLRRHERNGHPVYSRTGESALHGESPFLTFDGTMVRDRGRMKFSFSSIGAPGKILEGVAYIGKQGDHATLSADLKSTGNRDKAVAELQKIYCLLAVPGKPLVPGLMLGDIVIDGAVAAFTSCPAGKMP